jgi:hypothetical protein
MTAVGPENASIGQLREAFAVCVAAEMSGVLQVTGDPGGAILFDGGRVVAIQTPGAPSPEVLLLRSKRVRESEWNAAFAASAATASSISAELVSRQLVGAGELEALLLVALADALFVIASGTVDEYRAEHGLPDCELALKPGAEAAWLLAEASRRIRVLAVTQSVHDRWIVAASGAARPGARFGGGQGEILALADGRRTARDIAFVLGRGVYATMLQLDRMRRAGLLSTSSSRSSAAPVGREQVRGAANGDSDAAATLPRREQHRPSAPRRPWAQGRAPESRTPFSLLRPRSASDAGGDQTA